MMEQDTNIECLNKLLAFLQDRIFSRHENQWFAKDLYRILAPVSDARISDIHEQCIEDIIHNQASDFYKDFILTEIRTQLIADFIKMEHWRRRNNFQEFCMAMYQQIECIVNYLGRDESLNLIWRSIRNAGYYMDYEAKDIRVRWDGSGTIEKGIVYKLEGYTKRPELVDLSAMDKFKAILFMIVYHTKVNGSNIGFFTRDFFLGWNIYQIRNLNHRGNITETGEKSRSIMENQTRSMLNMDGFFVRFITGINTGFPISKEIVEFAEVCCRQENIKA